MTWKVALSVVAVVAVLCPGGEVAARCRDCKINGKSVNTAHGAALRGKTGTLECRDSSNGDLCYQYKYVKGEKHGACKTYSNGKLKLVERYRKGERHGLRQEYGRDGKLRWEKRYDDGKEVESKAFHDNGKLKKVRFSENGRRAGSIDYTEQGKLAALDCHPSIRDKKARKLCGFGGTPKVTLYYPDGTVKATKQYRNGKLHGKLVRKTRDGKPKQVATYVDGNKQGAFEEYDRKGKLAKSGSVKGGKLDGDYKEFHSSGKLTKHAVYRQGELVREKDLYLNGRTEKEVAYQGKSKRTVKRYRDDGKLARRQTEVRVASRWGRDWEPDGEVLAYHPNGKLASREVYAEGKRHGQEKEYDDSGQLRAIITWENDSRRAQKTYDKHGKLEKSEEYEEDGSRKR